MTCRHLHAKELTRSIRWCRECGAIQFALDAKWYAPGPVTDLALREDSPRKEESADRINWSTGGVGQTAPLDTFEPDECCGRHLAAALRNNSLASLTSWECPKCGATWKACLSPSGLTRQWKPEAAIAVFPFRG